VTAFQPSGATVAAPSALPRGGIAARLAGLGGWRRLAAAFAAGGLAALAQAPFHAVPVLWLSLPALVLLLDGTVAARRTAGARIAGAAVVGWWFGFGYFLAGLWWIGAAFLVEADIFAWALPIAVAGLPAGLALFFALGTAVAALLWRPGAARIVALAVGLSVSEWLRGHVLTGFPWNGLGTAVAAGDVLMQPAALVGAYGLVPIAVVVFAAPAAFLGPGAGRRDAFILAGAAAALALGLAGYGFARLARAGDAAVPGVALRLVQPAIGQVEKWKPENRWWIFDRLIGLTRSPPPAPGDATIVVWPESSTPFLLNTSPLALEEIAKALPPGGVLLAGAGRGVVDPSSPERLDVYNSVMVIGADGTVRDAYDKVHLVPFGEYLPFQSLLESLGVEQLARMPGGFSAGAARRALAVPGAPPAAPLVCYEVIFPGEALPEGERPGWILNLTNDAWFGRTPGPYQHFHQARLRAVEEGLPIVRAANTGISAVVDAYGRAPARLALGETGVLSARLPAAAAPPPYARLGDLPLAVWIAVAGAILARSCFRSRTRGD
jgi:apolipoprotein N-acyltransferase